MAIQKINLGTEPLGEGGDTYRSANTKINENFSNTEHAASKLVGTSKGRVPLAEDIYQSFAQQTVSNTQAVAGLTSMNDFPSGVKIMAVNGGSYSDKPKGTAGDSWCYRTEALGHVDNKYQFAYPFRRSDIHFRATLFNSGEWGEWGKIYTTANTKLDTNGAVAPSSPTIDLYSDHIETNGDGSRMNPEFVRNGVGDYTIKNTTGLRDEGWYIKIPNDMNGNPKVAVAIDTDKDGNLNIKTYKRTFSLETFTFGPDLDEPLDIPEGRWIDLRFNDLPDEELQEPEPTEDSE